MEKERLSGVLGLGMDLVEVRRFAGVIERQGEAFLNRVFTAGERAYCEAKQDPAPFFAARFAVKEAVAKAFGTGIGGKMGWLEIEVRHWETGAPRVELSGAAARLAQERGVEQVFVTISHTESMAGATVLLQ
jgi:holo-[acyl-carrier protein] synthase